MRFFHGLKTVSYPEQNIQVASAKYKKKKLHGEWSELHTMNETVIYILLAKRWRYHRLDIYIVWYKA